MRLQKVTRKLFEFVVDFLQSLGAAARFPIETFLVFRCLKSVLQASRFASAWREAEHGESLGLRVPNADAASHGQLTAYFEKHSTGRGIFKWVHYFEIYQTFLSKFVGREVHVVEIGLFSGGSLEMWKEYFGPECKVYGVDIEKACIAYRDRRTKIFIGDQSDRTFWERFRENVPNIDVVIDDGSHLPDHQIVTLEELLPRLRPGGIYICEDIHGRHNRFTSYLHGLAGRLNELNFEQTPGEGEAVAVKSSVFQQWILSIHLYAFITVIEKAAVPVKRLVAKRQGTEWQPFLH